MPIYEYCCQVCHDEFEELVFSRQASVSCPICGSSETERRPSVFATAGLEKKVRSQSSCTGCRAASCASCAAS